VVPVRDPPTPRSYVWRNLWNSLCGACKGSTSTKKLRVKKFVKQPVWCLQGIHQHQEVTCEEVCETACVVPARDPPAPRSYVWRSLWNSLFGACKGRISTKKLRVKKFVKQPVWCLQGTHQHQEALPAQLSGSVGWCL
jgi:hypothetical protein